MELSESKTNAIFKETNRAQLILWSMCLLIALGTVMIFCWCDQEIINEVSYNVYMYIDKFRTI